MLKVPNERPLDPTTLAILSNVNSVLAAERQGYFLIGANARDILLFHVFGIRTTRATHDVDFAIALETWCDSRWCIERVAKKLATHRLV